MGKGNDDDKIDPSVKLTGPMGDRKCRDLLFLLLFILFCIGWVIIAGFGIADGIPSRLLYGVDYDGNVCGFDNVKQGKVPDSKAKNFDKDKSRYLYYGNPLDLDFKVCRTGCPEDNANLFDEDPDDLICYYNVSSSEKSWDLYYTTGAQLCFPKYSCGSAWWRCYPDGDVANSTAISDDITGDLNDLQQSEVSMKLMSDFEKVWWVLLLATLLAVLLGFVWVYAMRFFAGVIIWGIIILVVLFCIIVTITLFYIATNPKRTESDDEETDSQIENNKTIFAFAFLALAVTLVLILIIIFMRKRIKIAIGIIEEASRAFGSMPLIIFFPFVTFVILAAITIWWIIIGVYLATASDPQYEKDDQGNETNFTGYEADKTLRGMQFYHFFGYLWACNFVLAIHQCTIAGAIASWYWVHDKMDVPDSPVLSSLGRVCRYHLGSMAFGSLILAIVQAIRVIIRYIKEKTEKAGQDNALVKFTLSYCACCFACFERFIKFLNKNAYIMIAIYGDSFCTSARKAFHLILSNILRVAAVDMAATFIIFLGKLFIVVFTVWISSLIMDSLENLNFYAVPLIIIAIISYFVSSAFMSIYDMAIDTILLSFLLDCEINKDTGQYFMSSELQSFVSANTKRDEEDKKAKQ